MKNDFDFIKEKIENSSVKAPEDMGEDFALKAIENVSPKPVALDSEQAVSVKKPRRRLTALAAAAASFVLIAAIGTAVGTNIFKNKAPQTMELPGGLSLRTFSDRSQVETVVKGVLEEKNRKYDMLDYGTDVNYESAAGSTMTGGSSKGSGAPTSSAAGSAASDSAASNSHSDTYKQVDGVDEADIIKTDGRYIYVADPYSSESGVKIFAVNGDSDLPIAEINVKDHTVSTPDEATPDTSDDFDYEYYYGYYYSNVRELYLIDNRLVVMYEDYSGDGTTSYAQVYDVSDIGNITLLDCMSQSGSYISSRMIGDSLYTVSSYYPNVDRMIPLCGKAENPSELGCDCIYAPQTVSSENYLVISAYDTLDFSSATQSKAIFGAAEDIYCSLDNLYIYCTVYDYENDDENDGWYYFAGDSKSSILKVDLKNDLSFTAYAEVPGYIDDQYALDEYNGNLRVATTSYNGVHDENNLYVLDGNLSIIGSVTGFAKNESIKAVRYIGNTAYVITYEQTDPLFVIDLTDPTAPAILGEVKITGFSTMLVPIDDNTILGIGVYTQDEDYTYMEVQEGVKLALFDVSDKANPKVLDSISYKDYYSEVTYDPKALVYNPERNDYVIPLNLSRYTSDGDEYGYGSYEQKGGMLNFKVENGRLVQITQYTADYEDEIQRCVYVGDTVYMIHGDYDGNLRIDRVMYE